MLDMAARTDSRTAPEAVQDLLRACLPRARRTATCILRDPLAAEDAVQEAALRAWDNRHSLRDPDTVEVWFNRILVNVCKQHLRRLSQRPVLRPIELLADDGRERISERDELGRAIARLHPDEQMVLALRYGRDMTVPQIAQATGAPEGTVKSRLHGAREHLRAILDAERRREESS